MRKKKRTEMTAEEKEMLRRLMETPGIEKEWDFFEDMDDRIPPPEYFMRGTPKRPGILTRLQLALSNLTEKKHKL